MCALLVGLVALGAADSTTAPISLAAPGLRAVNLDEKTSSFYAEHLAQQMLLQGIRVVTAAELSAVLGLQRQKELLGCTEGTCIAELASGLGVDGLLVGSLGKFGSAYQINTKVVSAADAKTLAVYSERIEGDQQLLDALNRAARTMAAQLYEKLGRKRPDSAGRAGTSGTEQTLRRPGLLAWVTGAGGVLLAGAGTVGLIIASGRAARIRARQNDDGSPMTLQQAEAMAAGAYPFEYGGYAALGIGAGLLAFAIYRFVSDQTPALEASLELGDRGAWVSFGGSF